jgi:uncharacterized protein YndB with AHSA1/START domain
MTTKLHVTTDVPNEIHMTRTFDAPRRLVIRAMTEPALLKRWLGGKRATVRSAEVDFRVGGRYRYEFETVGTRERFAFSGEFREVGEDRIVHTEAFDGHPGESLVTTTYTERDGVTTMHHVIRFESQAVRDMVLATGMANGAGESYDVLEQLLASQ